ncbi:hypothetical protein EET67_23340 [Pseudaminobacter arsenicus]|uniref:CopG family transcriptional regulator n=1 Tax=Borborobacter arsenicus TaxID=1851146 RepID=A0A432UZT5_9HYPH|nr:hypothetical protein [Pseudaminobacter arsenicus]RUM95421.1 hypothetical protein EET67_23340 [Pseudaminobacter arsenicus]
MATPLPHEIPVALDDEMLVALDNWRREQNGVLSQADAILTLLRDQLRALGYLPVDQEGTRPEDLNASNDD